MNKTLGHDIDSEQARAFLSHYLGAEPAGSAPVNVEQVGEGAWSRCFGFRRHNQDLVIRFGNHVDDFRKDQRAYAFATPEMPVPEVLDIGEAFDGYFAISTRAYGVPLESLDATQWRAVVPALVAALEAIRTTDSTATSGFGGWGPEDMAPYACWSERLLAIGNDTPDLRTHGWRNQLAASPQSEAALTWGLDLLARVADDAIPRCLVHSDLINRNVLVQGNRITGVFDWGCSHYGDHLYELAWFEFWAPWFPELDMGYLRSELEQRWRDVGYAPPNKEARLMACHLHIGLDHIAYNAYLGDWPALAAAAARMRALVTRA